MDCFRRFHVFLLAVCLLAHGTALSAGGTEALTGSAERAGPAFAAADADRNGRLSPDEFLKDRGPADVARRDFRLFDRDADGALTVEEFSTVPTVLPPDARGSLPDPMQALADAILARLEAALDNWADQPDREIDAEGFVHGLASAFRSYGLEFSLLEADADRNGRITRGEARRFVEIQLGIRRGDGKLLRYPDGRVVNYMLYLHVDLNGDDALDRTEFIERSYGGPGAEQEFEKFDADRNQVISFDEWCLIPGRAVDDPVLDFRRMDTNLDTQLSREELLLGTPDWKRQLAESVFPAFDVDRDGALSLPEYRLTMPANMVLPWQNPLADPDDNGGISFTEFHFAQPLFRLLRIIYFHRLDTNVNGQLEPKEFYFKTKMPDEFFVMNEDGTGWQSLFQFEGHRACGSPTVSPDGKWLAFDAWPGNQQSGSAVYVKRLDGGGPRQLGSGMMPSWSRNGKQLACSRSSPAFGVWLLGIDDETDQKHIGPGWGAQVSPDGRQIAYTEGAALMSYDLASGQSRTVLDAAKHPYRQIYWNAGWSPDSRRLCLKAMTKDERQEVAIVNMDPAEPEIKVHVSGKLVINADFAWHPGGKRVVFAMSCPERGYVQLYEFDPDRNDPPKLVDGQDAARNNTDACWTPDGKRLIVVSGDY